MDESQLKELYRAIKQMAETKPRPASTSLMSKLKKVRIQAPEDFATNLDFYTSKVFTAGQ